MIERLERLEMALVEERKVGWCKLEPNETCVESAWF
jgi:hypothetical protein